MARKAFELVAPHAKCKKNEHEFMVTNWLTNASKKKANMLRCKWCLLKLEMNEQTNAWVIDESSLPEEKS